MFWRLPGLLKARPRNYGSPRIACLNLVHFFYFLQSSLLPHFRGCGRSRGFKLHEGLL
jgi:hypothetical protein